MIIITDNDMVKETKLFSAMKACKGKKGCEFAACMEKNVGKAPKWAAKKCGHREHDHEDHHEHHG